MATLFPGKSVAFVTVFPMDWTFADLQQKLGGIPAERIRLFPPPGCATEEDVIRIQDHEDRLFELEDGILVEKAMGWYESMIAALIVTWINNFLAINDLGKTLGADGMVKLLPGMIKIPDVAFVSWERWPKHRLPRRQIPTLVPDLAVEVLSETNTTLEMDAKLENYFQAGVRLVWYIDPATQTAWSFRSITDVDVVAADGVLDGGVVLPGLQIDLRALFAEADRQGPR